MAACLGRDFTVATTPLNPEWLARYDGNGQLSTQYVDSLEQALIGTRASLWNAGRHTQFGVAAFTDAIHLRWSAAHAYSEQVVRGLAATGAHAL